MKLLIVGSRGTKYTNLNARISSFFFVLSIFNILTVKSILFSVFARGHADYILEISVE